VNFSDSKAIFLDRDGVINYKAPEGEYIATWHEVRFIPGAMEAVAQLNRGGYRVFIVTNQRGIAVQKVRLENLTEIHRRIKEEFALAGAIISEIYYCAHDVSEMCICRKPQPGMLRRAAGEHGIDLQASWMIGDSTKDVQAGEKAGCRTILLGATTGGGAKSSNPTLLAEDLTSAVAKILTLNSWSDLRSSVSEALRRDPGELAPGSR
jgi:D-glycero-D-manno-heptose 1,7-bisphosphate phosphatase